MKGNRTTTRRRLLRISGPAVAIGLGGCSVPGTGGGGEPESGGGSRQEKTREANEGTKDEQRTEREEERASIRTDKAGVPQPADESELQEALHAAPEHSLVECRSETTYRPSSPLSVPDWVTLDLRDAVIRPKHGGTVVSLGNQSLLYGGTIDMGTAGGIAVLNSSVEGTRKWDTGLKGTHVMASPGSGAIGHEIRKAASGGNNFYHAPVLSTDGVDYPLQLRAGGNEGFTTSINTHLIARDYVVAARASGKRNISHCYTVCDLTPGSRTVSAIEYDVDIGCRFCSEGWIRNPELHEQLLWIKSTKTTEGGSHVGEHVHLSHLGHSSTNNPELVRDDTGANDSYVIDFAH